MTTTPTEAARVRSLVDHPIIDADGHFVELGPLLHDEIVSYVEEPGGARAARAVPRHRASRSTRRRASPTGATPTVRRAVAGDAVVVGLADGRRARPGDRAPPGAALRAARRDRHRLHDPLPVDGARVLRGDRRGAVVGALPRASTGTTPRLFAPYRDRCTVGALIPMNTPAQAIAEARARGRASSARSRCSWPGTRAARSGAGGYRLDMFGLDSDYDYDPLWATLRRARRRAGGAQRAAAPPRDPVDLQLRLQPRERARGRARVAVQVACSSAA